MNSESSLWMGDIEPWMDEIFIEKSFIKCGFLPKSIKIIKDKEMTNIKRFCFVYFNSFQEANNALFKLNATKIPNTNILFKLNLSKYSNHSKKFKYYKNVYVGNLSQNVNDIKLYNIFKSKYPSVYYASIITDSNGISKGYGFVHFSKEDEYQKCLKEMNGIFIDNRIIRVKEKNKDDEKENKNNYIKKKKIISQIEDNITTSDKEEVYFLNNTFVKNIELLESDDIAELYRKIKESVDKMFEYYKCIQNINEISRLIIYYSSNYK
jgi:RNA recognition motif-containing protein